MDREKTNHEKDGISMGLKRVPDFRVLHFMRSSTMFVYEQISKFSRLWNVLKITQL